MSGTRRDEYSLRRSLAILRHPDDAHAAGDAIRALSAAITELVGLRAERAVADGYYDARRREFVVCARPWGPAWGEGFEAARGASEGAEDRLFAAVAARRGDPDWWTDKDDADKETE